MIEARQKPIDQDIKQILEKIEKKISPSWPLSSFVARNPMEGFEDQDFFTVIDKLIQKKYHKVENKKLEKINIEMIKWCSSFLDEGQSTITMPNRNKGFLYAIKSLIIHDKNLIGNNKNFVENLSEDPLQNILMLLDKLNVMQDEYEESLSFFAMQLPGWLGYVRWRNLYQIHSNINVAEFFVVQLLFVYLIWPEIVVEGGYQEQNLEVVSIETEAIKKEILHNEKEIYSNLLDKIRYVDAQEARQISDVQMIFCIDVRSEALRYQIEFLGSYETYSFAGFFGLPVRLHQHDRTSNVSSCPALLRPKHEILEELEFSGKRHKKLYYLGQKLLRNFKSLYQDLKYNFGTVFALVESTGFYAGMLMIAKTLMPKSSEMFKKYMLKQLVCEVKSHYSLVYDEDHGIDFKSQVTYGENALRTIGLDENFAPLIVIAGHGSATINNPLASSLDCGACGGNKGGPNAKILAAILNNARVREALKDKSIIIPDRTQFLAAEHNTTTDEVVIYKDIEIYSENKEIYSKLIDDLKVARQYNNLSRIKHFNQEGNLGNVSQNKVERFFDNKSFDWSETRPEWGLVGNSAIIVGPRSLTKNTDLQGACFLHSYDWSKDKEGKILEAILMAPMLVVEAINMQYFFSSFDNVRFGSGSKITQNVTGKFGVMQGNASDIMYGLSLQSLNIADNKCLHKLSRLHGIVYAPKETISNIIKKHQALQNIFNNSWVHLIAIDPNDNKTWRYDRGSWV